MPLVVEKFDYRSKTWAQILVLAPWNEFRHIPDMGQEGRKIDYVFGCMPDGKYSVVARLERQSVREMIVVMQKRSYSTHIKPDVDEEERKVRFRHI